MRDKERRLSRLKEMTAERRYFFETAIALGEVLRDDLRKASMKPDARSMLTYMIRLGKAEDIRDDLVGWTVKPLSTRVLRALKWGSGLKRGEKILDLKEAVIASLNFICPMCGQKKFKSRQWHVRREAVMCVACWMKHRGKKRGRARQGEPPVDYTCPRCFKLRKRRRQWDLSKGICKRCSHDS